MATTILKNQILKKLSKFTKDVDADQLKFSSLSQAYLSDLVLNEVVLTEVLELPVWMKLTRAVCSRVSIQIPWTQLSSLPIRISLDEVYVDMETCSELRPFSDQSTSLNSSGYGRTEMAVDGMLVLVNTLEVRFRAPNLYASFQVNRIKVFSTTPEYTGINDLRMTRLKDETRDAILVFKCVAWQTLRIEASSTPLDQGPNSASIRLITNGGQARIALKKCLSTCAVVASRLQLLMEDLLWVLNPSQLKAAFSVIEELKGLSSKADDMVRSKKAARKLDNVHGLTQKGKKTAAQSNTPLSRVSQYFDKIDIMETSYHFHLGILNLHICDEQRPMSPPVTRKYEDAALLIELVQLKVDYYPYHIPSTTRRHWLLYKEPDAHYLTWQNEVLGEYLRYVEKNMPDLQVNPLNFLMYACCVFRMEDFRVNNMTTKGTKKTEKITTPAQLPFCSSLAKSLHLPEKCSALHMEYIVNYFPQKLMVSPPHMMSLYCNPVQIVLDSATIDWLTLVSAEVMSKEISDAIGSSDMPVPEVICRVEVLLPKVLCPADISDLHAGSKMSSRCLQLQCGRVVISNTQTGRNRTLTDCMTSIDRPKCLLTNTCRFPNNRDDPDVGLLLDFSYGISLLDSLPLSLWSLSADPVWLEFIDLNKNEQRPVPFVDAFPVCLWLLPVPSASDADGDAGGPLTILVLVDIRVPSIKSQSTGNGYNVLLRSINSSLKMLESISVCMKKMFPVPEESLPPANSTSICLLASLPELQFTMLLDGCDTSSRNSDRLSVADQLTDNADSRPKSEISTGGKRLEVVGSREDLISFDGFPPENEAETGSMRSVMSESSIPDMSSYIFEEEPAPSTPRSSADPIGPLMDGVSAPKQQLTNACPSPELSTGRTVRLLTVHLNELELLFAAWGVNAVTKLSCTDIHLKETGDMELSGANERYYSGKGPDFQGLEKSLPTNASSVLMRFHIEQSGNEVAKRLADILCRDMVLSCSSEAFSRLSSFFQTDIVADPVPLRIGLRKFSLSVLDTDRLTGGNGGAPFGLSIPAMICHRGPDGIFHLHPEPCKDDRDGSVGVEELSVKALQDRISALQRTKADIEKELLLLQSAMASRLL